MSDLFKTFSLAILRKGTILLDWVAVVDLIKLCSRFWAEDQVLGGKVCGQGVCSCREPQLVNTRLLGTLAKTL